MVAIFAPDKIGEGVEDPEELMQIEERFKVGTCGHFIEYQINQTHSPHPPPRSDYGHTD